MNTRWRDFADIAVLSRNHSFRAADLQQAIATVARYRLVTPQPLSPLLSGFADAAQPKWAAWRRRLRMEDHLPPSFGTLLGELIAFADPLLTSESLDATWNPGATAWE